MLASYLLHLRDNSACTTTANAPVDREQRVLVVLVRGHARRVGSLAVKVLPCKVSSRQPLDLLGCTRALAQGFVLEVDGLLSLGLSQPHQLALGAFALQEAAAHALDLDDEHLLLLSPPGLQHLLGNAHSCTRSAGLLDAQRGLRVALELLLGHRAPREIPAQSGLKPHNGGAQQLHLAAAPVALNATQLPLLLQHVLQLGVLDAHPRGAQRHLLLPALGASAAVLEREQAAVRVAAGDELLGEAGGPRVLGAAERHVLEVHVAAVVVARRGAPQARDALPQPRREPRDRLDVQRRLCAAGVSRGVPAQIPQPEEDHLGAPAIVNGRLVRQDRVSGAQHRGQPAAGPAASDAHAGVILPWVDLLCGEVAAQRYPVHRHDEVSAANCRFDRQALPVMPCFDKKLEASRKDFQDPENATKDVDCVLATTEIIELIESLNVDFASLDLADLTPEEVMLSGISEDGSAVLGSNVNASSGGHLEHIFRFAAKELFNVEVNGPLEYVAGRNPDFREVSLVVEGKEVLKFAIAYGFRNIQSIMTKIRRSKCPYHYVEIMACPSGCLNGGGQIRPKSTLLASELLDSVTSRFQELQVREPTANPAVKYVYEKYLGGVPFSEEARGVLHTQYHAVPKMEQSNPLGIKW
ncbi:hypothetical protein ON010_g11822 [Phytophthora cinnamomi]|nr:hypothetical protein ON010_g11822 [Phytophthora cinnamomi]